MPIDDQDERIITETGLEARIAHMIEPTVVGLGYRLVRVKLSAMNGTTLQVMAEKPDGTMSVEDCERLSRDLSPTLDADDPIERAYHLEVSSPGIDRPLVRRSDFERWAGHTAKIGLSRPQAGRKRLRGVLRGIEADAVQVELAPSADGQTTFQVPFADIEEAKLILTDELIADSLAGRPAEMPGTDEPPTASGKPAAH